MKRLIYAFLFLLTFGVLVSCTTKVYKLNVNFDSTKGTVTYTQANKDDGYTENTEVTIQVTPFEEYEIKTVVLDGEEVKLTNGTYTFVINKNTEVSVEFSEKVVEPTSYTVEVKVNNEECVKYELLYNDGTTTSDGKFLNGTNITLKVEKVEDSKLLGVKVNNVDVELTEGTYQFVVESDILIEISAEMIDKSFPLSALTSMQSSFEIIGAYHLYYAVSGVELFHSIQTTFDETSVHQVETDLSTGEILYDIKIVNHNGVCATPSINLQNEVVYYDSEELFINFDNPFKDLTIDDFVYVEEGKFELVNKKDETAMCITGWNETIASFYVYVEEGFIVNVEINTTQIEESDEESYYSVYRFEVFDYGTASTNIRVEPYERVLEHDALEVALAAITNNYTVNHRDIWEGEEDIVYNVLVDAKGTYSDYVEEGLTYGYVELNGYVYQFSYDGTTVTIGDPLGNITSIADVQSDFSAFNVALFEYVGEETYVVRDASLASVIVPWIGEDYDTQKLGQYATSLKIILKEGKLYQVIFEYLVYGQEGTVVLTYSQFGETEITIDFSNCVQVSVLDEYIGVWTNENHEVIVTKEGFTIDGVVFIVEGYEEGIFYGTLGESVIYVVKWTENELAIYDENGSLSYIVGLEKTPEEVVVPENYKGVWASEEHKIIVQTNVIVVDGEEFVVTGYTEETGLIGKYQGKTYYLVLVDDEISTELFFTTNDLEEFFSVTKTAETYIEIPKEYVGTWKNNDETMVVEITFMGITINGLEYTISTYDELYGFTGTYNGVKDYMVAPYYSADKIQIGTMEQNYVCTKVEEKPVPPVEITIPTEQIGTYVGEVNGVTYEIIVTETAITINGVEYILTAFDEYEGFTGMYNNEEIYLMYVGAYGEDPTTMYMFNEDASVFIACIKEETGLIVEIPEEQFGTYVGEVNGSEYKVVIDKGLITINGVEFIPESYDEMKGYTGKLAGETYIVVYLAPWYDYPAQVEVKNSDGSLDVICDKDGGEVPPVNPTVQAEHVGTYTGEKNGVTYDIEITLDGIIVNGVKYEITAYDSYEGYTGTYNGEEYYIVYYETYVIFMDSSFSFYVQCNKTQN